MSNSYRKGYRAEKKVADLVGGKRVGILGKEDISDPKGVFSYEVKMRKKLPKFLKDCYEQACANCGAGKHPVVVLKEKGKRYDDAFVIMRLRNFLSWLHKKGK